jgi:hypothetical protein
LSGDPTEVSLSFCELFLNGVTGRKPVGVDGAGKRW